MTTTDTSDEREMMDRNAQLLTKGDETEIVCELHGVTKRWGDLDGIQQEAVLAGLDIAGECCIMESGQ